MLHVASRVHRYSFNNQVDSRLGESLGSQPRLAEPLVLLLRKRLLKNNQRASELAGEGIHALGNAVGGLPGVERDLPSIDLRAEGGYVLASPSAHVSGGRYEWLVPSAPIADAPAWLREPPRHWVALPSRPPVFEGDGTRLGLKVLRKQLSILARVRKGQRNHTLNRCAFAVGRYVAAGHLLDSAARAELTRVGLSIGLTRCETARTIDSAFSAVDGGIR